MSGSIRLTRRGWGAAGLAVTALGLGGWWHYPGLMAAGAAFGALVLFGLGSVALPVRWDVARTIVPLRVPRKENCVGRLSIVHNGRWSAAVDAAQQMGIGRIPIPLPAILRPGQAAETGYLIPTDRRGLLELGPIRLRRWGIGDLACHTAQVCEPQSVRVLPRLLPVRAMPPGGGRGHSGAERVAHGGTDLVGLREYLPGDDLRRVHAATSARAGILMVREDSGPSQAQLTVLLDDRAASYHTPGADPEAVFEEAVDTAASLLHAAAEGGQPVRLFCVSHPDAIDWLATLSEVSLSDDAIVVRAGLDPMVAVTGAAAALDALSQAATVLVVDAHAVTPVAAIGPALVLRAPTAESLLLRWDETMARPAG